MSNANCEILSEKNVNEVPITNEEYEKILNIQQEILSLTAQEANSQEILDRLCTMAEELLPNAIASLMLKDPQSGLMLVKAAPTVPPAGWDALNGIKPGPHSGSCGNAIFHGEAQYIVNTFEDNRGTEFLDTAKAFNLCSCWSMPVKNELGLTIGSFALSSFEHRSPAPFHKKLLETGSSIATIALKNEANKLKIQKMIYEDALTGLKNKLSLQKELEEDTFYTLIFLDVNNFSYVNTAYGFDIGDKILLRISTILEELFPHNTYRINADQFAIRFEEKLDLIEIVGKIRNSFAHTTIDVDDVKLKISFNYGGIYSDKNLLKHAALAIKKSKESGKNRLYIFNEEVDSSKKRESFIYMNNRIYKAFHEDLIVPYFQGIYDNTKNKIIKYEALVRIVTKDGKITSPYEFLEVARLSGLLPKLTRIMIDKTFKIMSQNSYDFSINITEDDLSSHYLLEYLSEKSTEYSVEPYRVTLEILEGVSASGQKNNIKQLKDLKRSGYKLAIDDFGTEYSNFERVLALDVDFLKIDARYIKNIDTDKKSYEIVKAIVNFSNNMYITTVAEFVHSKSVQKIVKELGINLSQGYYFSEPTPTIETKPLNS